MTTTTYDVAVIGGGAAGLSAALVLGRARRRVAVIDAGAPRNAPAAHMQGFLSRDGMPPTDLLARGREEVRGYGVELIDDRVVAADDALRLDLASGRSVRARTVLLATGAVDQLPDIPGARERWGRDFLHCPYCHGWEVRDQAIGVLGSVEHAHLLRQWSDDVALFAASVGDHELAVLAQRGIAVFDAPVTRLVVEDDRLSAVELDDGQTVPRDAVFMRPALSPLVIAGLDPDAPGVWTAGNVTNPRAQVITAAGEGSAAAIAINQYLVDDDIERARS